MGPAAKGDNTNLVSFQCVGEHAASPYSWNTDDKTWTGSQLLFSKAQIDAMNVAHKGVPFTIMAYEDDDTACQIKSDADRASKLFAAIGVLTKDFKSAKGLEGKLEAAPSLFKLLAAIYSFLTTADDIIGVVVSDAVTGRVHAGRPSGRCARRQWADASRSLPDRWNHRQTRRYGWQDLRHPFRDRPSR